MAVRPKTAGTTNGHPYRCVTAAARIRRGPAQLRICRRQPPRDHGHSIRDQTVVVLPDTRGTTGYPLCSRIRVRFGLAVWAGVPRRAGQ